MANIPETRESWNKDIHIEKIFQHLESKGWKFIKAREYQNTFIFKSPDEKRYLHFGDSTKIQRVIELQTNLYKKGYPVAPILKVGNLNNFSYMLESSLGEQTYGEIFEKGIESQTFKLFCDIISTYFEAQIRNQLPPPISFSVRKEVMAENVIQENSDLDLNLINSSLDKLQSRIQKLPFTYSHGDFAARNILEKGVIDFEFCSVAPLGLDVFTACEIESFWMFKNENGKIHAKFSFDKDNLSYIAKVLNEICSKHNLDVLFEYQNDFILFKAFWSTAYERQQAIKSKNETKWKFRRTVLMYCIEKYLKDQKINPLDFRDLSKI
jgi:hypothetical protein